MIFRSILKKLSYVLIPILFFFISYFVDWNLLLLSLKEINILLFIFSISITLIYPLIGAFRWQSISRSFEVSISFWNALRAVMVAFSANLVAPAKTGDFIKAYSSNVDNKKENLASAVILERVIDLISLGLLGFLGAFFINNSVLLFLNLSLVLVIISIIFCVTSFSEKLTSFFKNKISEVLIKSLDVRKANSSFLIKTLLFSSSNWILGGIQTWLFFSCLNSDISLFVVLSIFPATVLISILPITPGGLGVRESGFIFMFLSYASSHISTLVSLFYYIFVILFLGFIGLFFTYYVFKK